jgi:tripeptidyl-peptidase-1
MLFASHLAAVLASSMLLVDCKPLASLYVISNNYHCQFNLIKQLSLYSNHVVHETKRATQRGWKKKDRVHKDAVLPVRIGLAQNNLDKGHSSLMDVADPRSPNYGKHWSAEKVRDHFAPSMESVNEVMEWLKSSGVPSHRVTHSKSKGWLAFDAQTHEVEDLLKASYHEHHHTNGEIRIGTDECV